MTDENKAKLDGILGRTTLEFCSVRLPNGVATTISDYTSALADRLKVTQVCLAPKDFDSLVEMAKNGDTK